MSSILSSYFNNLFFVLLHLFLGCLSFIGISLTLYQTKIDRKYFKSMNLDDNTNIGSKSQKFIARAKICLDSGVPIEFDSLCESYREDRLGDLSLTQRSINLFLLCGVVGTLLGLFDAIPEQNQSNLDVLVILKKAFESFGVTVVSIILSSIFSLALVVCQWFIKNDVESLRDALTQKIKESLISVSLRSTMAAMEKSIHRLDQTLNSETSLLGGLKKVYDEIDKVRINLDSSSQAIQSISKNIEAIPDSVSKIYSGISEIVQKSVSTIHESFEKISEKTEKSNQAFLNSVTQSNQLFLTSIQKNNADYKKIIEYQSELMKENKKSTLDIIEQNNQRLKDLLKQTTDEYKDMNRLNNEHFRKELIDFNTQYQNGLALYKDQHKEFLQNSENKNQEYLKDLDQQRNQMIGLFNQLKQSVDASNQNYLDLFSRTLSASQIQSTQTIEVLGQRFRVEIEKNQINFQQSLDSHGKNYHNATVQLNQSLSQLVEGWDGIRQKIDGYNKNIDHFTEANNKNFAQTNQFLQNLSTNIVDSQSTFKLFNDSISNLKHSIDQSDTMVKNINKIKLDVDLNKNAIVKKTFQQEIMGATWRERFFMVFQIILVIMALLGLYLLGHVSQSVEKFSLPVLESSSPKN
jgi:hypothetical protein